MSVRKILHLDLDAFFCAVEEQRDPALRGITFAVGGKPDERGVVASCSYAARAFGVRSAMPMSRAVRLCPGLVIVHHHFDRYHAASEKVMDVLNNLTPLVEQISIDEAFLDVSGLRDDAEDMARRLQAQIRDELALPCSLGVATNKLVAKIANNIGKSKLKGSGSPNAITVVPPGDEGSFLAPLDASELWGVGPKTAERLASLGMRTIGDIARWPEKDLAYRFGKSGADLARRAQGIDDGAVETERETKSVSHETTFAKDVSDEEVLKRTIREQADGVGRRLRKAGLAGTTIHIKLRWSDFTTLTRQITRSAPTDLDAEIYEAALQLFEKNWPPGKAVRLIGVGASGFDEIPTRQLGLWDMEEKVNRKLQSALDELRDRFGSDAIKRGSDRGEE